MKISLLGFIFSILLTTCGTQEKSASDNNVDSSVETEQQENKDKMLLNIISKDALMQDPFSEWFNPGFEEYTLEEDMASKIGNYINDYQITIFMGTWCSDSQREVPKFYKILQETDYDMSKLEIIAVDRNKTTPENLEAGLNIEFVPTIIFNKDGEEVNRFVEFAQESIAEDILKIVSGKPYKNSYAE